MLSIAHAAEPLPQQGVAEQAIVVTGTRLTPDEARRRAVAFVDGTGVAQGHIPAARWVHPVCLSILGLFESRATTVVETRMREIAEAAGIRVARGDCDPNVRVAFTADARAAVREVERRSPRRLAEVPRGARDALLNGDAPVRWWYLTGTRSRHGIGSMRQALQVDGGSAPQPPVSVEAVQHYDSSMISTQVVRYLSDATIVIDVNAATGFRLDAVAAYAAFVAFAEIRADDFAPPGSILGLFEAEIGRGGEPTDQDRAFLSALYQQPLSLAAEDRAFLSALYRLPLDRQASRHRGLLVRDMVAAATAAGSVHRASAGDRPEDPTD